jgi:hypothetical protein
MDVMLSTIAVVGLLVGLGTVVHGIVRAFRDNLPKEYSAYDSGRSRDARSRDDHQG